MGWRDGRLLIDWYPRFSRTASSTQTHRSLKFRNNSDSLREGSSLLYSQKLSSSKSKNALNEGYPVARMVVEGAFGQLKCVWRILGRKVWRGKPEYFAGMTYTYCILHNIHIHKGKVVDTRLYQGYVPANRPEGSDTTVASDNATESYELRSTLKRYLWLETPYTRNDDKDYLLL